MYIVIDPGHGGKDPGAVNKTLLEKNVNWNIANDLQGWLAGYDCRSKIIQPSTWMDSDAKTELYLPVSIANKEGADLFVSLHVNAGGGTGFESFCYNAGGEADRVRKAVHGLCARYLAAMGLEDRGPQYDDLYVLHWTKMPALLLEVGFIDNPEDMAIVTNPIFSKSFAWVLAQGIVEACGLVRKF